MNELIKKAERFAREAHEGLVRPNRAQEPYWKHLQEVALLVRMSGGSEREIAAAWLHDTVEDTDVIHQDIVYAFGYDVATLVQGLTDPKDLPPYENIIARKRAQADRVSRWSESVKRVKLADQISNVRSVRDDPPVDWTPQQCLEYIEGAAIVANECMNISTYLDREFAEAYQGAVARYSG